MPRGRYPREYFHDPVVRKPIDEIYADLDGFTFEIFADEASAFDRIAFAVVVPPVIYEGRFVKGLYYSQGVDALNTMFPQLRDLFQSLAWTMWSSFPWATTADGLLTTYDNAKREDWYRIGRLLADQRPLIPLANPDYTHEYQMAPTPVATRDIDVLCVSRLHDVKNIPMIARALRVYRRKYSSRIRMTLVLGLHQSSGLRALSPHEQRQWQHVVAILGRPEDYIDVVPHVSHDKLAAHYSRARVVVLGALLEGKSRVLSEAMSCNTPVICFEEFNQHARDGTDAIPPGAGLYARFEAESLADALHAVIRDGGDFTPRRSYLRHAGRLRFLNRCLDMLPYFRRELPEFEPGEHDRNVWLDLAVQHSYQMGLRDFVYNGPPEWCRPHGPGAIGAALEFFERRLELGPTRRAR